MNLKLLIALRQGKLNCEREKLRTTIIRTRSYFVFLQSVNLQTFY